MVPPRFSLCTCNLWNRERWPEREPALRGFLQRFRPDVLAVQELCAETRACIDDALGLHERVRDKQPGWTTESNLWWRRDLFEKLAHGTEPFGSQKSERRLFWVRLRWRADGADGRTLLLGTFHLAADRPEDRGGGQALRLQQTEAILEALRVVRTVDEPTWLLGDLNEAVQPARRLHAAGFMSCFAALGLEPPPTFPALPTSGKAPHDLLYNACYDWILARGPVRPLAAHSPHTFDGDLSPSDHWPIVAVYEME